MYETECAATRVATKRPRRSCSRMSERDSASASASQRKGQGDQRPFVNSTAMQTDVCRRAHRDIV